MRHVVNLVLIIAVLLLGRLGWAQWNAFQAIRSESTRLVEADTGLTARLERLADMAAARAARMRSESMQALESRVAGIDQEISLKRLEHEQSSVLGKVLAGTPIVQAQLERLRLDAEINILEQERSYLLDLKSRLVATQSEKDRRDELERLRIVHASLYRNWQQIKLKKETLEQLHPLKSRFPGAPEYKERGQLQAQQDSLLAQNMQADTDYQRQLRLVRDSRPPAPLAVFKPDSAEVDAILQPLRERIFDLNAKRQSNWIGKLWKPVEQVAPTAFLILLSIIFTPITIKALFYFVLAPLAARRPPIRLLPETDGALELETSHSAVSQSISVDASHELLVHPEFLQSSSVRGSKDTRWLLAWRYPMTSLASGMVALTRIRAAAPESFVISATRDPFSEIGILSLPSGTALVMQPHNLVGVVQPMGAPIRITSHWRLNSLHAWLTLQLRYLAFHGPARLIVQGCRGVRIEPADAGRSINQAATIGFSANLAYSTRRCETFASYLLGKQELLNDNFSSENTSCGFYVYEEMPHFGKKTGMNGRGLEGFTDSVLKVLGV